jgi:hypothetical protein
MAGLAVMQLESAINLLVLASSFGICRLRWLLPCYIGFLKFISVVYLVNVFDIYIFMQKT